MYTSMRESAGLETETRRPGFPFAEDTKDADDKEIYYLVISL